MPPGRPNAFFMATLERVNFTSPHVVVPVLINGNRDTAWLDSGAATSMLSSAAAAQVGATLSGERQAVHGLGGQSISTQMGTLARFSLGNETIRNARVPARP